MIFNARSISMTIAVVSFFCFAVIGWSNGLSQLTCAKRASIAAFVIYICTSFAVKAVNVILTNAIADKQAQQPKEEVNGSSN
ncbi:MAG: hypothetical protein A2Y10_16210 [Planctomycetes bacterium GWF2_41_51]|nr:MAG: hypothetical protein A2Y10_16210 [Planctomycetes bacterium GWF2_41_51]HBG26584.1 hypothetical protein [Phycisphaerales bacterium]